MHLKFQILKYSSTHYLPKWRFYYSNSSISKYDIYPIKILSNQEIFHLFDNLLILDAMIKKNCQSLHFNIYHNSYIET